MDNIYKYYGSWVSGRNGLDWILILESAIMFLVSSDGRRFKMDDFVDSIDDSFIS